MTEREWMMEGRVLSILFLTKEVLTDGASEENPTLPDLPVNNC